MAKGWYSIVLLRRAASVFDNPQCPLALSASAAGKTIFGSGAAWMRDALRWLRGGSAGGGDSSAQPAAMADAPVSQLEFNLLGFVKYGVAASGAIGVLALAWWHSPWWALGVVPAFYALEAQWVFLFPLALDGSPRPFREARQWTRRAGGTLRVMFVVLPLAATMMLGGFFGRGFVRSWCLGCLAVCLWYEDERRLHEPASEVPC